tara:strand:- start:8 stop:253 length:246 start_codon:yes stop_codon:yes gene_type:complete
VFAELEVFLTVELLLFALGRCDTDFLSVLLLFFSIVLFLVAVAEFLTLVLFPDCIDRSLLFVAGLEILSELLLSVNKPVLC